MMLWLTILIVVALLLAIVILVYVTWILAYDRGWNDRGKLHVSRQTVERLKSWQIK